MFSRIYKLFLFICFLFGLSPYFTLKPTKTTPFSHIARFIPCGISVAITVAFFIYSFAMNRTIFLLYGQINDFIGSGYLLILIVSTLSGNYQCIRYHQEYLNLMKRIFRRRNIPCLGSYKSCRIRTTFMVKGLLILATYFSAVLVLFINETTIESIFFKIEIAALQFVLSLNTLHVIMYIEMVRSYLKASVTFILNRAALMHNEMYIEERHFNLKRLKKIYFDWWMIMQRINIFFGWSLLAMLIKSFVEISYTFYYYFVRRLQANLDTPTILRKELTHRTTKTSIGIHSFDSFFRNISLVTSVHNKYCNSN